FGGINLEDISAPECFIVEKALREQMNIPVFHDDQHGTAIIVAAAVRNALFINGKQLETIKLVATGAGAASLACLNLLVEMGLPRENVTIFDSKGMIRKGREKGMDEYKEVYATQEKELSLLEALTGADIFLGLSAAGIIQPEDIKLMADSPVILALANPEPEILPEKALAVRPNAIIATGRSDYPNQVNNVLCFPFLFRGALDVGATVINEAMKIAAVDAIANLAKRAPTQEVDMAYGGTSGSFGPDNLIPKPFDPRLIVEIAPAVAKAAMDSGVATRPIRDFEGYVEDLTEFVYKSGSLMKPIMTQARSNPKRVVYVEGERRLTLQAVQQVVNQKLAFPVLLGRKEMILSQIKKLGFSLEVDTDFEIIDPLNNPHFKACWQEYQRLMGRRGATPATAKSTVTSNTTVVGSLLVKLGYAEAMLVGTVGKYAKHLSDVKKVVGLRAGAKQLASVMVLALPSGTFFISDTHVSTDQGANELAQLTIDVSKAVERFGITPKVALLSRSNFGSMKEAGSAQRIRDALAIVKERAPELEVDGEMHADTALSEKLRSLAMPESTLTGVANTLIMPNADAAHISYNLLKMLGRGVSVGPILIGSDLPIHVVTNSASVRGMLNMTAIAVADAQAHEKASLDLTS
ncbi:MAG: malate dehydrogenase (oxaloacetate-decarboxylating)(NADP+), partial [Saprospiraceae bacterium]